MRSAEALVVGAGPAGLAVGACLQQAGIQPVLLEQADEVGASWGHHYDRLRLHTVRWLSGLPGLPIPKEFGKWVGRDDLRTYLEAYRQHHQLDVRLNTLATSIRPGGGSWAVQTSDGVWEAKAVVVATGYNREPHVPAWPGRASFSGRVIHSSEYSNPDPYRGQSVLVVGTGNSGAEIAADLAESGAAEVWLAVRTPPNILRRQVAGVPTQALGVVLRHLPIGLVDRVSLMVQRVTIGNLSRHGLEPPPRGMYRRLREEGTIPVLDVGLVAAIKAGRVSVVGPVQAFDGNEVVVGGRRIRPAVVVAATGFRRGLESLVGPLGVLGADGTPLINGAESHPSAPGLYFIGFSNPISGNLREIAIDSKRIARRLAREQGKAGDPRAA